MPTLNGPQLVWKIKGDLDGQVVTICKDSVIDITLQLVLENGSNKKGTTIQLGIDNKLELSRLDGTIEDKRLAKTDASGTASFGAYLVGLKKPNLGICPLKVCPAQCYGSFFVLAKANGVTLEGGKVLQSTPLKFHIICNRSRPTGFIYDVADDLECPPDELLPRFGVSLVAEDFSVVKSATTSQVSMTVRRIPSKSNPQLISKSFTPTSMEEGGQFIFEPQKGPFLAGNYNVFFSYDSGSGDKLESDYIDLTVKCGEVHSFKPLNPVPVHSKPIVTNTSSSKSRCILQSPLEFYLVDKFDNRIATILEEMGKSRAELDSMPFLNGTLEITIAGCEGQSETPKFIENKDKIVIPIVRGELVVKGLMLNENTVGSTGTRYKVKFFANFPDFKKDCYELEFIFFNDSQKHVEIALIDKEREDHLKTIADLQKRMAEIKKTVENLKKDGSSESSSIKQLRNLYPKLLGTFYLVDEIDREIERRTKKIAILEEKIRNTKLNTENVLEPAPEEFGVIGKIAHLAVLTDEREAHVLSWHMQGDMDCIVTTTTHIASELHKRFNGTQQLLPVEGIYKGNLPKVWDAPLPHKKIPSLEHAHYRGNPVFARTLFQFVKEQQLCETVFGMLLGDTLIIDTLDEALLYRSQVVQYFQCPTILTRSGERLRNNGKFGGNKAPTDSSQLRHGVFSLALKKEVEKMKADLQIMSQMAEAMQKKIDIDSKLKEYELETKNEFVMLRTDLNDRQKKVTECGKKQSLLLQEYQQRHQNEPLHPDIQVISSASATPEISYVASPEESQNKVRPPKRYTSFSPPTPPPVKRVC